MTFAPLPETNDISVDRFLNDVVPAGQPLVMRGAAKDWAAVRKSSDTEALSNYLRGGAGSGPVSVMRAKP